MPSVVELAELAGASYENLASVRFPLVKPGAVPFLAPPGANAPPASGPFPPPGFGAGPAGNQSPLAFQAPSGNFGFQAPSDVVWSRTQSWTNSIGFSASLYQRAGGGIVLAFRGTDDGWDALFDDAAITAGAMPPQAIAALIAARGAGLGSSGYVTGHSLGGALALIAAAHLGLPAVTFNAPGAAESCTASASLLSGLGNFLDTVARCGTNPRVRNIRIDGDPVSSYFTTGLQTGGRERALPAVQCGLDGLCRHGIRTCIAAVRVDASNYDPLSL